MHVYEKKRPTCVNERKAERDICAGLPHEKFQHVLSLMMNRTLDIKDPFPYNSP